MRRAPFIVLLTVFLSLLAAGLAGTATAGGPTSVLLVAPGEGRTAALYHGSPEYDELARLVGASGGEIGSTTPPEGAGEGGPAGTTADSDPGVTVTWLAHDVSVWRVDRVFLTAEGGPWISTQSTMTDGDLWSAPARWHRAGDAGREGKALSALLDRLGVGRAEAAADTGNTGNADPAAASAPRTAPDTPATPAPVSDGWVYGPAGLLLGVVLTLAARKWPYRNRSEETGRSGDQDRNAPDGETLESPAPAPR